MTDAMQVNGSRPLYLKAVMQATLPADIDPAATSTPRRAKRLQI
jgi:hypothetical protein